MAITGGLAQVFISRDGRAWTNISDATYGLDGLEKAIEESTVEVGGGGIRMGADKTGYVQGTASMTLDENERTGPVLTGYSGKTLYVRYRREGEGTGKKEESFSGPCTISHELGERDKRRYSVELMINGPVTETTQ